MGWLQAIRSTEGAKDGGLNALDFAHLLEWLERLQEAYGATH